MVLKCVDCVEEHKDLPIHVEHPDRANFIYDGKSLCYKHLIERKKEA